MTPVSSVTLFLLVLLHATGDGQPMVSNNLNPYVYASDLYADAFQVYSFLRTNNYFTSPLNFDAVPGMVLVGGKDKVYLLSSNLTQIEECEMPCGQKVCPNNLVRLYSAPSANSTTLVVCGSAGPLCSLVDISSGNFTLTSEYVLSSPSLLTSDPNTPSLGIFTNITTARKTNFFAASGTSLTFHTLNTSDPTSLGTSLKFGINSTHNTFNLTTWFSSLLVIVDVYKADYPMRGFIPPGVTDNRNPDEHKYLFVFVREQDPMTSLVTNKLIRLCQNDPGSVSAPNGLSFPTTLLKANISCQSASGPMKQNLLQGVVFSRPGRYFPNGEWVELMYGTFTDYSGYSPQTSICVYRANDSDYSLASGANNKGVFDIFRSQVYDPVGGRNIANNYVECTPNGRTDLQSQQINLAQSIQQYNPEPLAILSNVVVTKMAVDKPCVLNGSSCILQDVLFLGTHAGSILKMSMSSVGGQITPVISEDIKLRDAARVRQMEIQTSQQTGVKYLYVNTDNGIYKLPLERCGRFQGCSGCVASRDPYCVWDTVTRRCIKYTPDLNITMLVQNISGGLGVDCPELATSPSPFVSNSPIPTTTTTTTTTTTMMLSLVATTTSTTRTSASSSSVPSDPTPYVTTTPPPYIDAPTPNIGTVQGVADSQPLTLTLAPALGVTLPIILALLLVVAILLVCLLSFRSKRYSASRQQCESPLSITPLTTVPSKGILRAAAATEQLPRSGGDGGPKEGAGEQHLYGELETNTYDIYAPLQVVKLKSDAETTAVTTPHEYSIINH